jgi:hypothetical protein
MMQNVKSKLIGVLLTSVLLTGCDPFFTRNDTNQCYVTPLNLGYPKPLHLDTINGTLYLSSKKEPTVELTLDEYSKLLKNNKKIENYIYECRSIIDKTEGYYQSKLSK